MGTDKQTNRWTNGQTNGQIFTQYSGINSHSLRGVWIGTKNPIGPESEGTDGGNVGSDVISPQEGASDDKIDEPAVLLSNPPPNEKILVSVSKIFGMKKNTKKRKRKK